MTPPSEWTMTPVGVVRSPFREKFGIPRQPGLAAQVESVVELLPPFDRPESVAELAGFSHLWLIFVFHATAERGWRPTVRPPRLGGNRRVGVFASRSTHRPNPIGLSVVELVSVDLSGGVRLTVRGADLLDGTPVLDIKPYLPFVDAVPDARSGYVDAPPAMLPVIWSDVAAAQLGEIVASDPSLESALLAAVSCDPRPAYQQDDNRIYAARIGNYDVRWQVRGNTAFVLEVVPCPADPGVESAPGP